MKKYEYEEIKEIVFALREKRYTYKKIAEEISKGKIKINEMQARGICKKIYEEKEKEEPTGIKKPELTEEDLFMYKLRKEGKTYRDISEELEKQMKRKSPGYICQRLKRIKLEFENELKEYEEKNGSDFEKINKDKEILENRIYELRKEKNSINDILTILKKEEFQITYNKIKRLVEKIFEDKQEEDPLSKRVVSKEFSDEAYKIYELRKKGYTLNKIAEEFEKEGKKISYQAIQQKLKRILKVKGEKDPKILKRETISNWDEQVYNLKEKGYSNGQIAEELSTSDTTYTSYDIKKSCIKSYAKAEKEIPNVKKFKITKNDRQAIELRKQGYSYGEIAQMIESPKYPKTVGGVYRRFKQIKDIEGDPLSQLAKEKWQLNEKIYDMRKSGMDCIQISKKLNEEGIEKGVVAVREICKKVRGGKNQLARMIINLTITKGATWEQVEKMAEYYGVDLEKTMNSLEER